MYEREQWAKQDDADLLASDRRRKARPAYSAPESPRVGAPRRSYESDFSRDYGSNGRGATYGSGGYGGGGNGGGGYDSGYGGGSGYDAQQYANDQNPEITQAYQQRGGGRNGPRYDDGYGEGYPESGGVYAAAEEGGYGYGDAPRDGAPLQSWVSEAGDAGAGKGFFSERTFAAVGASEELVAALASVGAETPSHVQALGFKKILAGGDTILADQTGSGKTLAYLAPIVQALRAAEAADGRTPNGKIRALVVVPTSELAQQVASSACTPPQTSPVAAPCPPAVYLPPCIEPGSPLPHDPPLQVLRVARGLSMGGAPFRSAIVTGEHKWATQKSAAEKGLELLVSTPGRLAAHLGADPPSFSLGDLRHLVLDEVDVLYEDADFDEIWRELRVRVPPKAGHTFVTATLPPPVENAIARHFPLSRAVKGPGLHQTRAGVLQKLVDCSAGSAKEGGWSREGGPSEDVGFDRKVEALLQELEAEPVPQTLVFCNTIESCRRVENALRRRDRTGRKFDLATFHAAITPEARKAALAKLTGDGQATPERPVVLICTDRASRGMDFPAVGHVVLFDFPRDGVEYVRRVGRATRGGNAPGRVTSLALGRQLAYAKALMKANQEGERIDMDTHG